MSALAQTRRGWLDVAELGGAYSVRALAWCCRLFGRSFSRWVIRVTAFYYLLLSPAARASSRQYFARLHARGIALPDQPGFDGRASFGMIYRHFCTFAEVGVDRLFIASGQHAAFEVTSTGRENLEALRNERRGALLVGAHLGSFEAMRLGAVTQALPINMVVNVSNAQRIQTVLEKLDPNMKTRLIPIGDNPLDFVLKIRECIERGEMVAILADRIGPGSRAIEVDFLGDKAPFASGPFMLAATLHCPVYLTFGLYRGGNRYDLYCEKFADAIELPRKQREAALAATAQRYAERLEAYVQKAPYNWFNFYDFWGKA